MKKLVYLLLAVTLTFLSPAPPAHAQEELKKGSAVHGENLFLAYCFVCHGPNGKGDGPYAQFTKDDPRDLTDTGYFSYKSDRDIYNVISKGGTAYGKSVHMKPIGFKLTPSDIEDLVAYIRFLTDPSAGILPEIEGYSAKDIYKMYCATCHGEKGEGDGPLARFLPTKAATLSDKKLMDAKTDKQLYRSIAGGPGLNPNVTSSYMPLWQHSLTKEQMRDLIQYIRTYLAK